MSKKAYTAIRVGKKVTVIETTQLGEEQRVYKLKDIYSATMFHRMLVRKNP